MTLKKDILKAYLLEMPNYLSIFILAIFFLSLSPILLDVSASTSIKLESLNIIFTFFIAGSFTGQLTAMFYNRKFSSVTISVACLIMLMIVTFALSLIRSLYGFYILYYIAGYLLGIIWFQANHNILRSRIENKDRLTTVAYCFYPLGAFLTPYISLGLTRRGMDWQFLYYILIFFVFIIIILYLSINKSMRSIPLRPEEKATLREVFQHRGKTIVVVLAAVMLGIYNISENVIATWAPTYLRSQSVFVMEDIAPAISLFWLGILSGRIIVSVITGRVKAIYLVIMLASIAFASTILFYYLEGRSISLILIFITGIGYSAIFPLLFSIGGNAYTKGKGILITFLLAGANLGIALAPLMTSYFSRYGISISISLAPVFMAVFIVLSVFMNIYTKKIGAKRSEVRKAK